MNTTQCNIQYNTHHNSAVNIQYNKIYTRKVQYNTHGSQYNIQYSQYTVPFPPPPLLPRVMRNSLYKTDKLVKWTLLGDNNIVLR